MCKLTVRKVIKLKPYKKPPSHDHSTGGEHVFKLWMTDMEAAEFNIEVDKDYYTIMKTRSTYYQEEAIMHMIYLKYPEMFEE